MNNFNHKPVLIKEVINNFNIKPDGIYVDCTLGLGGHACEILKKLKTGFLICFDKDINAIKLATEKLSKISNSFQIFNCDYSEMIQKLDLLKIEKVDGILIDLGVSSMQLEDASRGFSYHHESKLDMRMDINQQLSAWNVINEYSIEQLSRLIYTNTESKYSNKIAKAIIQKRPINTTFELNEILKKALPSFELRKKHPGKTYYQAFRIEVNNELESLKKILNNSIDRLSINGVLEIITFHSIEDRIVKNFFHSLTYSPKNDLPIMAKVFFVKKQIIPTKLEISENNRARSAKLRILKRISI